MRHSHASPLVRERKRGDEVHRRTKRFQKALRHIDVRTLIMHQRPQAVRFGERGRGALPQGERLLDTSESDLTITLAIGRPIARQLEAGKRNGMRGVVQVREADEVRYAPQACGAKEVPSHAEMVFDLPSRGLVTIELPSFDEPLQILPRHSAPPRPRRRRAWVPRRPTR